MELEKWRPTFWPVLLALLVAAEGANLAQLDCTSALRSCQSEDYARCLESEDQWPPTEPSRTACYCSEGLPRSCADLCDNSSGDDSRVECRRRCSDYSACLDARGAAAPPAGVVINGPSPPLHSKLTAATRYIPAGSQPPSAEQRSSTHWDSGSSAESPISRDGILNALVLNALQQWWVHALLVTAFVALIAFGIVKMKYCHDDSRRDTEKQPPKALAARNLLGTTGNFAYRPLAS